MSLQALALVLTAAVLHALWNLAAKQADVDGVAFVWLYVTGSPARESSIVVGALLSWLVLREPSPRRRLVGAVVVLAGIAGIVAGWRPAAQRSPSGSFRGG